MAISAMAITTIPTPGSARESDNVRFRQLAAKLGPGRMVNRAAFRRCGMPTRIVAADKPVVAFAGLIFNALILAVLWWLDRDMDPDPLQLRKRRCTSSFRRW
jgi:hypothetical protein